MMTKRFVAMSTAVGLRFGPVRKGVTPKRVLEFVLQDMIRIKDDGVLHTDPDSICHNKGMMEAYRNVAHFIAPFTSITNGNGNGGLPTPPK